MGRASSSPMPPPGVMAAAWLLSVALLAACASALTAGELQPFGAVNGDTTVPNAGGPYTVEVCHSVQLRASAGLDACGRQRTFAWDLDDDGKFDDAVGSTWSFYVTLRPGVYPIRARASSPSPCAGSPPEPLVLNTTVTVTYPETYSGPAIKGLYATTELSEYYGVYNEAYVGERFSIYADINIIGCRDVNLTFDCGPGSLVPPQRSFDQYGYCQYGISGEKRITVTLEEDGSVASAEVVITVTAIATDGPYEIGACESAPVNALALPDACGRNRVFNWDFDGDGAFDDAGGTSLTYLRNDVLHLSPGVHLISVQASSSPPCPASPPVVRSTTVNITTPSPVIVSVTTGKRVAAVGESIRITVTREVQTCLPFTQTIDCGPDNAGDSGAGLCKYNIAGVKMITVTLEQFGVAVSKNTSITIAGLSSGGPYRWSVCSVLQLSAVASADACGQARLLAWDLDNDGVFDDAFGLRPTFKPYEKGLSPGVHPISVRASSSSNSCPNSPPEVVSTTLTVVTPPPPSLGLSAFPESGFPVASVGERVVVTVSTFTESCAPSNLVINCGAGNVQQGNKLRECRYSSLGIKIITATISQFGASATRSVTINVTAFYTGGPYLTAPCTIINYLAVPNTNDACGRQRLLAWDLNNDGAFDDATGNKPIINTSSLQFAPGVHPIHLQSSSSPACPASPTQVYTINVTIVAGVKLAIRSITTVPSGITVASTGQDIQVVVSSSYISCLPKTITVDCGADNVSNRTSYCRYNTPGQKVITATITQNGVSVSSFRNITIAASSTIGGPYKVAVCGSITVTATGAIDTCGNNPTLAWEFNNDGVFDDASGTTPLFNASRLQLQPGVYPLSVQISSSHTDTCPNTLPVVILTTNVTVTGPLRPPPRIYSVRAVPESANVEANVGEDVLIDVDYTAVSCLPFNLTINCGPGHVGDKTGYCHYNTTGVKLIRVTLSQAGVVLSHRLNLTVVRATPVCATIAFPDGRIRGRQGCPSSFWSNVLCAYPNNIKPYTKLYKAFASRASEDAQLIQRLFGNRTIAQALRPPNPPSLVEKLAREATAALLNAELVYYAQCPLSVKLDFRHSLYDRGNFTRLTALIVKFDNQNAARYGCPLYNCSS